MRRRRASAAGQYTTACLASARPAFPAGGASSAPGRPQFGFHISLELPAAAMPCRSAFQHPHCRAGCHSGGSVQLDAAAAAGRGLPGLLDDGERPANQSEPVQDVSRCALYPCFNTPSCFHISNRLQLFPSVHLPFAKLKPDCRAPAPLQNCTTRSLQWTPLNMITSCLNQSSLVARAFARPTPVDWVLYHSLSDVLPHKSVPYIQSI